MTFSLFNRWKTDRQGALPVVPEDTSVYAIGDIHGRADLLRTLLAMIEDDAQRQGRARNVLILLGDYVDRGPDSRGVIELLLDPPLTGFQTVCLMGNHEDMMLTFLDDAQAADGWLMNGGQATLESYGVMVPPGAADPQTMQDGLCQALPPSHLTFLRGLALYHVEGDFLFVHAGVRPGMSIAAQDPHDLIWIRDDFLRSKKDHGQVVVHGHSVTFEPSVFPDRPRPVRIGIDTGAYLTGSLTCLAITGTDRRWLRTLPGRQI